jgi:DNA-binding transcriptional LysR family regulator
VQNLDLTALEIFRTVATEGSVTRAAEKLNRVQSNISTRIRQLEQQLAKDLFLRRNRGLTLTDDGRLLLSYAERLLRLSEETSEALNGGRPSGGFRIGTMESTAAARLPEILSRYHGLHPEVAIEVETDVAGAIVERLLSGDVEAAFVAEPVTDSRIETRPVFVEQLVLVAPRSFPSLEDTAAISGRTVLAFEAGCAYRRYLETWLLEAGVAPGGIMSLGSYLAILACVSAGTGFAVVPQSVLDTVASKGQFQRHPLPGRYSRIRTLLGWRRDYRSAKLDALKALLPSL